MISAGMARALRIEFPGAVYHTMAEDGFLALDQRAAGDGSLHAGDAGDEPHGSETRAEAAAAARSTAGLGTPGTRGQMRKCHNSRTDRFPIAL